MYTEPQTPEPGDDIRGELTQPDVPVIQVMRCKPRAPNILNDIRAVIDMACVVAAPFPTDPNGALSLPSDRVSKPYELDIWNLSSKSGLRLARSITRK